jgi:hypothetical protein
LVPRQLCKLGRDVRGFSGMPQHRSINKRRQKGAALPSR